jgi:hypothetical protein
LGLARRNEYGLRIAEIDLRPLEGKWRMTGDGIRAYTEHEETGEKKARK